MEKITTLQVSYLETITGSNKSMEIMVENIYMVKASKQLFHIISDDLA